AAVAATIASPAGAQPYYPPQPYPGQPYPYPQQQPYGYPQQYPYGGYPQNQNVVGQIIDQLLGNRYNVTDRQAIRSCGFEAMRRAQAQYGGGYPYGGGYGNTYGNQYGNQYGGYPGYMRIVGIDSVERRSGGLRVRGQLDTGRYRNRGRGYGDLT